MSDETLAHDSVTDDIAARAATSFVELVAMMDRLRSPGGCPWDAEQTHASLAPYAIEEAHEMAEAAEAGDARALREELGDLLLQVVFHARIAQESAPGWDVADVVEGLAAKLRFRHPHVFDDDFLARDPTGHDAASVRAMWDDLKSAEARANGVPARTSLLDGIPVAQPALARSQKILSRARKAGIALGPDPDSERGDAAAEIGAELLAVVARAAAEGVDAEAALRSQIRALEHQVREAEQGGGRAD